MAVNPMDYSGKATVLDVVQTERAKFYDIVDVPAVIRFSHPSEFVLTTYQRIAGGQATGDRRVIDQFRKLFFRI